MTTSEYCNNLYQKMLYFIIFIKKKCTKISGTYICNRNNENEHFNNIVYHIFSYYKGQIMSISMINENVRIRFSDQLKS